MRLPSLSIEHLRTWAHINNVRLHGIEIRTKIVGEDGSDRGGGLVATQSHQPSGVLLTIPRELILNKTSIQDYMRTDRRLREAIEAIGPDFLKAPRLMIMLFLLLQLTPISPDSERRTVSTPTPLADYAKFLPKDVYLPTRYSTTERETLLGTSLDAALDQKLKRLELEFDHLKEATQNIEWCSDLWWSVDDQPLTLDEWKAIDAMYRSRALELPDGIGDSMVPVLDMANHSADDKYNARFQLDDEGNAQLVVRDHVTIPEGTEITIMYGCGGACEMIFSYGFLDAQAQSARELFLDIQIPDDDPLRRAKIEFAREAPGVRIYTNNEGQIRWESSFVWWACVNQEDGMEFHLLQETDGTTDLQATWKGLNITGQNLSQVLKDDPAWDIFQLRAVVLIQSRVERQGIELSVSGDSFPGDGGPVVETISRLRDLEMELLAASHQTLEAEKARLLGSETVRSYLSQQDPARTDGIAEDFS